MPTTGVTVAIDQGFVRHLKAGRLEVVTEISRFESEEVVLRDGRRLRPDLVLAPTGYRPHVSVLNAAGLPVASSPSPGLWFIGFRTAIEGNLRQHPIEAGSIACAIARARSRSLGQPARACEPSGEPGG